MRQFGVITSILSGRVVEGGWSFVIQFGKARRIDVRGRSALTGHEPAIRVRLSLGGHSASVRPTPLLDDDIHMFLRTWSPGWDATELAGWPAWLDMITWAIAVPRLQILRSVNSEPGRAANLRIRALQQRHQRHLAEHQQSTRLSRFGGGTLLVLRSVSLLAAQREIDARLKFSHRGAHRFEQSIRC
jgi:hypothetical protein